MEPLTIEFKNYKLLKDQQFKFPQGSNLYFVIGSNGKGKTSFLNGLLTLLEARNTTPNPVTFGEKEGNIKFEFLDNEGISYSAKFEFTDEKGTFTLSSLGMLPEKKVTAIRDFFDHRSIIAEEFVKMGSNASDRKKQRDIFLDLMPAEKKQLLLSTEENYSNKYKERTEVGKVLSTLNASLSTALSKEERDLLDQKDTLKAELENIQIRKDKQREWDLSTQKMILTRQDYMRQLEIIKNTDLRSQYNTILEEFDNKIEILKQEIRRLEIARVETTRIQESELVQEEARIDKLVSDITDLNNQIAEGEKIQFISDPAREQEVIQLLDHINQAAARGILLKQNAEKIEIVQKQYDEVDKRVKELQKSCQDIIKNNSIPISFIRIHSDGLYYFNGETEVPFCEEQVGTSEIYRATLQILLALNKKTPIILMGRAESLDYKSLEEIDKIAKEYQKETGNKVSIVFDRVIPNETNIQLIAYEDLGNL